MAKKCNDRRKVWTRSVWLCVAVLCVALVAMPFVAQIVRFAVYGHYQDAGHAAIRSMEKRRPQNVTPRAWHAATTWASIAYCNVCCVPDDPTDIAIAEVKSLGSDLEARCQNDVDLSTVTWIWERLKATGPQGRSYYEKFWPEYRQQVAYAQASDETLPILEGLSECQDLDLRGTLVTDAGLAHLKEAKKLQSVYLSARITDAGMSHLIGLTGLRRLSLVGTKVSDAGLEKCEGLSHLQELVPWGYKSHGRGCEKAPAGIAELQD